MSNFSLSPIANAVNTTLQGTNVILTEEEFNIVKDALKETLKEFSYGIVSTVNIRDVWKFIESKKDFSNWVKARIDKYGFTEGKDFIRLAQKVEANNATKIEYFCTLDMAKELGMLEANAKGKLVRGYFIQCEELAKQAVQVIKEPSTYKPPVAFTVPDFGNPLEAAKGYVEVLEYAQEQSKYLIYTQNELDKSVQKIDILSTTIEEQKPAVEFVEDFVATEGLLGFRKVCKLLKIKEPLLRKFLIANNVISKVGGNWIPKAPAMNAGRLTLKLVKSTKSNYSYVQMFFTTKGFEWLQKLLKPKEDLMLALV